MKRIAAGFIAVTGWLSLLLQFVLHITNPLLADVPFPELLVRFFSYFTIWANVLVAVTLTVPAFSAAAGPGRFFSKPSIQAAAAVHITMVGVVYSMLLRGALDLDVWNAVADHALHDVIPILYVAYWLIFAPKAEISWTDPLKWLAFPAVYFAYSLLRGAVVGRYPYWFADVELLGYPTALTNAGFVLLAFAAVGFIYAGTAKLLSRTAIVGSS
jgi:hypothetical protein